MKTMCLVYLTFLNKGKKMLCMHDNYIFFKIDLHNPMNFVCKNALNIYWLSI